MVTAANVNEIVVLEDLVRAIPPVAVKVGHPRSRPDMLLGDRAYDSQPHRDWLWACGIVPMLAEKGTGHGSGLGAIRWVVERTISWLHGFRRLRIRFERRVGEPSEVQGFELSRRFWFIPA